MLDAHPEVICGPELSLFSHPFFWSDRGLRWQERLLCYMDQAVKEMSCPDYTLNEGVCPYVRFIYTGKNLAWYGTDLEGMKTLVSRSSCASELVRYFYGPKMQAAGKRLWAEKSPPNIYSLSAFLESFPSGHGILIVRDGRDVVCSLIQRGFEFGNAVAIWVLEAALCMSLSKHPRLKLVRYEDLIQNPREVLEDLTAFLGISPAIDDMLAYQDCSIRVHNDPTIQMQSWKNRPDQPISLSSIGRWRMELSPEQMMLFYSHRLQGGFPGLSSFVGLSGTDLLQAFDYPIPAATAVTWHTLSQYLWHEKSILTSLIKPQSFHTQYVNVDLDGKLPPMLPNSFLKLLAEFAQDERTYCTGFENTENELSNTSIELIERGHLLKYIEALKKWKIIQMILGKHK
jgi:hypothetical protein